jgi:hypothetical protein
MAANAEIFFEHATSAGRWCCMLQWPLGYLICVFGSRFGGPWGGLLSLCAFTTMPAFLAFGPLVLTDIPVTLFSLLC